VTTSRLVTVDCDYLAPQLAAAYLRIEDNEAAFVETCTTHNVPKLLECMRAEGVAAEAVRWVIVTHVHLDHAGGASALMRSLPNATLLAHPRAARHLIDPSKLVASARAVYGAERFDSLYGTIAPIDPSRVRTLEDGDTVDFGRHTLQFLHTRGHANHHFVVVDKARSSVFTGDAFGLIYPRLQRNGLFAFPSTSPTDFDAVEAHKSITRIAGLGVDRVALTHFGEFGDVASIAQQLHTWIDHSEALVTYAAQRTAEEAESWLRTTLASLMNAATQKAGLVLTAEDQKFLQLDVDLNAQGLAWVASKQRGVVA
jgi:glyoxylase-like metal-dependent hydrolase (beta-lactamase superfamily II)